MNHIVLAATDKFRATVFGTHPTRIDVLYFNVLGILAVMAKVTPGNCEMTKVAKLGVHGLELEIWRIDRREQNDPQHAWTEFAIETKYDPSELEGDYARDPHTIRAQARLLEAGAEMIDQMNKAADAGLFDGPAPRIRLRRDAA